MDLKDQGYQAYQEFVVYLVADIFKTAIIAIDQLPETEETLWLRVLGRDGTQERAIREVLALPTSHPRRNSILRLLTSWKVRIDLGEIENFGEQEALMALSESFLAWERQTEERIRQRVQEEVQQRVQEEVQQRVQEEVQQDRRGIALNLLRTNLPLETIAEVTGIEINQLQRLRSQLNP